MSAIADPSPGRRPPGGYDAVVQDLMRQGWSVNPGFFSASMIQALRTQAGRLVDRGMFRDAGVGRGATSAIRPDIRGDRIVWLDARRPAPAQAAYLAEMEALRRAVNEALYLGLFDYEGHYAVYPTGAWYRRHRDCHHGSNARRLSCITYLNAHWREADGGALRLYQGEGEHEGWRDVYPEGGTLVCFLSEAIEHEVLATRAERWSITGWFRVRP